jgi:lipopolysaccharide export system protein LptC
MLMGNNVEFMTRNTNIFDHDRRYGNYVRLMKIILPASSALVVALLLVYPVFSTSETGFTLDFAELQEHDDTIRMVAPHYAGTDKKGRSFQIKAESAYQNATDTELVHLDLISAEVSLPAGGWMALDSLAGTYHPDADLLDLSGQVNIFSDIGYEAHSRTFSLDMGQGIATSKEQVHGQGPFGVFESGGMELDMDGNYIHLTQGVSMTVYPRVTKQRQ